MQTSQHLMNINTEKVRQLRRSKDFSQDYMAEIMGLSQSQYSRIENGDCAIDQEKVKLISDILEVNPLDILELQSWQSLIYYYNQLRNTETSNNNQDFEEEIKFYITQIEELKKDKEFLREQVILLRNLLEKKA